MLYSLNKVVKDHNPEHLPWLSMIDEPFMLWVKQITQKLTNVLQVWLEQDYDWHKTVQMSLTCIMYMYFALS